MGKNSSTSKIAITLISIIIAAGLIFCIVGLIMAAVHGTGFAEEITSWFTKTVETVEEVVENPEQTEEVVETALHSIASFFKLG